MDNVFYEMYYNNVISGEVNVSKSGAYYSIAGKFYPRHKALYRLYGWDGARCFDLGLGVFKADHFEFLSSIPINAVCGQLYKFFIKTGRNKDMLVVPRADSPFPYLSKLENAYLDAEDGVYGIRIKDQPAGI